MRIGLISVLICFLLNLTLSDCPAQPVMQIHQPDGIREFRIEDIVSINFRNLSTPADREKFGQVLSKFMLLKNYPNPFNPSTTIPYELYRAGPVEIAIYDISGRKIATLLSGEQNAGHHRIVWNGRTDAGTPVPVGTYICRLTLDGATRTQKMILLK